MRWVDDALAQILKRQLRAEPLEVDWQDPRLQLIDLAGDGFPDVLIDRGRGFVCCRSKGADGFDMPRVVRTHRDEPGKPVLMHADAHTPIQLADMTGDGLVGLVRIRIGEVCHWQNLGHADCHVRKRSRSCTAARHTKPGRPSTKHGTAPCAIRNPAEDGPTYFRAATMVQDTRILIVVRLTRIPQRVSSSLAHLTMEIR